MQPHVAMCVSCRMALGKLRRMTNIAYALKKQKPEARLTLLVDAGKEDLSRALPQNELNLFSSVQYVPAAEMASVLKSLDVDAVVVDTMRVRDLHEVDATLCLILREVLAGEERKFRLQSGRHWDVVILPHPEGHWNPDRDEVGATQIQSIGWIYRSPQKSEDNLKRETPTVLITTGGGSGEDRGNDMHSDIQEMISALRLKFHNRLSILQVAGPRDRNRKLFQGVDEIIEPGPELHHLFPAVDLVISAAGYNSVLELAVTDVPVLLIPIPRYSDDQEKRAISWGTDLGMCYIKDKKAHCIDWMAEVLKARSRRPVSNIGPSGADAAAALILQVTK